MRSTDKKFTLEINLDGTLSSMWGGSPETASTVVTYADIVEAIQRELHQSDAAAKIDDHSLIRDANGKTIGEWRVIEGCVDPWITKVKRDWDKKPDLYGPVKKTPVKAKKTKR